MENSKIADIVNGILADYLKENKCRRTPERFAILNAIYSINGPFEIETLLKHLEENEKFRVSRATVYNTISLLMNANLVTHHQLGDVSCYEKSYGSEKAHLICTKCGKITEINNINLNNTLANNIKKFHQTHYSLHIYGLCNKCHQAMKRRKARMTKKTEQQ